MPKLESEEESSAKETGSSSRDPESEEKVEPTTPPPEKKKRMDTWALDKKKHASAFKTLVSQKRPVKTPRKGESS